MWPSDRGCSSLSGFRPTAVAARHRAIRWRGADQRVSARLCHPLPSRPAIPGPGAGPGAPGTVRPVRIEATQNLPYWAQPGVTRVDARLQRITALSAELDHRLSGMETGPETHLSWNTWEEFARDWAELCGYLTQTDLEILTAQKMAYQELVRRIDPLFAAWLGKNYTPLGSLRLPSPHHVHHIPHYLAYQRALGKLDKAILLVLDGLSLGDWQVIHSAWGKRHMDWHFKNEVLLAQIPTITSISRYALISGLRPADFAGEIDHNYSEARAWELCWSREGVGESTCKLISLAYDRQIDQMPELQDPRINFWCLIDDTLDKLVHHASLGAADQQSSLRLWLDPSQEQNSAPLEALIGMYLNQGFSVFIASDHGHVEASGFGQPSEGLLVQTRGKRARIYTDVLAALRVQNAFADTILWEKDGLLPDQMTVLMPARREAFAPAGEVVVTHGGISIDEAIVPFIQISKESQ